MKRLIFIICALLPGFLMIAQDVGNDFYSLAQIKTGVKSKRIGSWDRTGGNDDTKHGIKSGERLTLMDVKGPGVITHIWITIAPDAATLSRNDIILRMYWDGNTFPSVEAPIGPFFGNGWQESYNFVSAPLAVSPGWGKSYVCYFAMPFAAGARIEIENQAGREIDAFYFNIDYTELTAPPKNAGRFHAWYNHELTDALPKGENEWGLNGETGNNKNGKNNYLFADITGKGQFVGVNYYVNNPSTMWYGEGDEMVFIDGDTLPTIVGTGTEDFFNTSWCPKEIFYHPFFGYPRVNGETGWLGHTHLYRFMIADPFYFDKSCRFTIEHGHNNNLTLDLSSVAYWYLEKASPLPRSFTKQEREYKPMIGPSEIFKWRQDWRNEKGNGTKLWGNE